MSKSDFYCATSLFNMVLTKLVTGRIENTNCYYLTVSRTSPFNGEGEGLMNDPTSVCS